MLAALMLELVVSSAALLILPVVFAFIFLPYFFPYFLSFPDVSTAHVLVTTNVNVAAVMAAILIPDYLLTIAAATIERRPRYLLFAPAFLPMRVIDAAISLYALPKAWLERSNGQWRSPTRRATLVANEEQAVV